MSRTCDICDKPYSGEGHPAYNEIRILMCADCHHVLPFRWLQPFYQDQVEAARTQILALAREFRSAMEGPLWPSDKYVASLKARPLTKNDYPWARAFLQAMWEMGGHTQDEETKAIVERALAATGVKQ